MAHIALSNIVKQFAAGQNAVDGVSFSIADGAFCVLLGPSGCGKSTLLRMIAGLEDITSGDILIGDRRVNDLSPKDRDIAMVFQNYALYPHLSVLDNIAFPLEARGVAKRERRERAAKVAQSVQLDGLLQRRPSQLSGGQRQRVALARAIIREPKAFLFDEPLSNLDAKMRQVMRVELRALHTRLGVTSVYVTHDQEEALALADIIVVMNAGKVRQVGSPSEVFNAPADRFVAGFVGVPAMNFLPCEVDAAGTTCTLPSGKFLLPAHWSSSLRQHVAQQGGSCVLGVRPSALQLCGTGTLSQSHAQAQAQIGARVASTEMLGDVLDIHCVVNTNTSLVARVPARALAKAPLKPKDSVAFSIDFADAHMFASGEQGLRICGTEASADTNQTDNKQNGNTQTDNTHPDNTQPNRHIPAHITDPIRREPAIPA